MRSFPCAKVPIGRFSEWISKSAPREQKNGVRSNIYRNARKAGIKIRKGFARLPTVAIFKSEVDLSHTNPFEAIRHKDLQQLMDTFIAGADLTKGDQRGNTPLHLACGMNDRSSARMIMTTHAEFQPWLTPNSQGVRPVDIAQGGILEDINCLMIPTSQPPNDFDEIRAINEEHMSTVISRAEKRPPRILIGVDGGGVKGVALVLFFRELDLHTRSLGTGTPVHQLPVLESSSVSCSSDNSPPFLQSMVDWMGCTSVGAIIGAHVPVEKLRLPYHSNCEGIRSFLLSTSQIFGSKANNQKKRSEILLEEVVRIFGAHSKLSDINCKFFMNTTSCNELPARTVLLRNYHPDIPNAVEMGYEDRRDMELVKAISASAAAPVFFNAHEGLSDGGVIMKNPTMELLKEFHRWQRIERQIGIENNDVPGLILSLGTGRADPKPTSGIDYGGGRINYVSREFVQKSKNLLDVFMIQSTTAESYNIAQAEEWSLSIGAPYYRINPRFESPMLMNSMDVYVLNDFMWEVMLYLRTHIHDDLRRIAKHLADIKKGR